MPSGSLNSDDYKIKISTNCKTLKMFCVLQYQTFIQYLILYVKISKYIHLICLHIYFNLQ